MVTIERERLISEKQNNKASPKGARLSKEAMLLREIFKLTKPSMDAFCPFELISMAAKGQEVPPIALTLTFIKHTNTRLTCRLLLNEVRFDVLLAARLWTKTDILMCS